MHKASKTVYLDSNLEEVPEGSPYIAHTLVREGDSMPVGVARKYGLLRTAGEVATDQDVQAYLFPRAPIKIHGAQPAEIIEAELSTLDEQPVDTDKGALRSSRDTGEGE